MLKSIVVQGCAALALLPLLFATGCASSDRLYTHEAGAPEAISLRGEPLYSMTLDADTAARYTALLREAESAYRHAPEDELTLIWLGRRTAYLGRYREAISIYSEALRLHPFSIRLLRHRGHRYLTVREFERAEEDLYRASRLAARESDAVEPDGLPNAAGIPLGTTFTNIWYHLGLAHYYQHEYDDAIRAFERVVRIAPNDDVRMSATYWHVVALIHAGRTVDARRVLETIPRELEIIENHRYVALLRLLKGDLTIVGLLGGIGGAGDPEGVSGAAVDDATTGFGIGVWHELNGRRDDAMAQYETVASGPAWPAFGAIAAEVRLAAQDRE